MASMPLVTPEERVGTTIGGRYCVDAVLGRGGMGAVMRGRHVHTGREVAIKLLLPEHARDPDRLARFFQEARAAASLAHPNVVDTLDMDVDPSCGQPYLVLELLDGEDLAALLDRQGPLAPQTLLGIALPVMDALAAAHDRGIVHRDLKPENIFVSRDARGRRVPKVLDFGIAKLLEGESAVHTVTGGVLGTPHFMSPEQAMGGPTLGTQSDVWSMGAVLYVALTGRHPFEADTLPGLVMKVCTEDPPPLEGLRPDLPAPIARAVHRALQRELDARWPSMEAFGAGLVTAAHDSGIPLAPGLAELFLGLAATRTGPMSSARVALPQRASPSARPRRAWVWAALGGVALAALALTAALLTSSPEAPRTPPRPPIVATVPPVVPPTAPLPVGAALPEEGETLPDEPDRPDEEARPPARPTPVTPATVPTAAAPSQRDVRLHSTPAGAEVESDGVVLGRTPMSIRLAGWETRDVRLTAPSHEPLHVEVGPGPPDTLRVRLRPRTERARLRPRVERVRRPRRRGEPLVPR